MAWLDVLLEDSFDITVCTLGLTNRLCARDGKLGNAHTGRRRALIDTFFLYMLHPELDAYLLKSIIVAFVS